MLRNAKDLGIESTDNREASDSDIKPFQIRWNEETKQQFKALVNRYDPMMPVAVAVLKLVKEAIKDNYLPGYIRQDKKVFENELAKKLIKPKNNA